MRSLDELSGPWVGWWIQWGKRGHMRLGLTFVEGRIRGNGRDETGPFDVIGEYTGDAVRMAKSYGTHVVLYDGRWNDASIAGKGEVPMDVVLNVSEFEMWPEREGTTITEILALADEALERRDKVPATTSPQIDSVQKGSIDNSASFVCVSEFGIDKILYGPECGQESLS